MRGKKYCLFLSSLISVLICAGCATVKDLHQQLVKSVRTPGEKMVISPEDTLRYNPCSDQKRDALVLFEAEVIPGRLSPGKEINHRIRYATCLAASSEAQKGEIIRAVYYKNHTVFRDRTKYEFKPGTWTVDAFIMVPDDAAPGTYTVDTTVICKGKSIRKSNTFQVKNGQEEK